MTINFPSSPVLNQIYTYQNRSWQWNGIAWIGVQSPVNADTLDGLDASAFVQTSSLPTLNADTVDGQHSSDFAPSQFAVTLWTKQGSDPTVPAAGKVKAYFKAAGLYYLDEAGTITGPIGRRDRVLMAPYDQLSGLPGISGNNINPFVGVVDRTIAFTSWVQGAYVLTTNNASNYWNIRLNRLSDGAMITQINTSAVAPGGWRFLSSGSFSIASIGTPQIGCYLNVSKIGSPGNLLLAMPLIEFTW
jgi:hypothetical protein